MASFGRSIWAGLFSGAERVAEPKIGLEQSTVWAHSLETERARIRAENPAGIYKGRHYAEYAEDIRRLKREDPSAAEALLLDLIAVVEAEARTRRWKPPPAYYEHLAILRRKRRDYISEIAVLEQHEAWHSGGGKFAERLEKAKNLLARR